MNSRISTATFAEFICLQSAILEESPDKQADLAEGQKEKLAAVLQNALRSLASPKTQLRGKLFEVGLSLQLYSVLWLIVLRYTIISRCATYIVIA